MVWFVCVPSHAHFLFYLKTRISGFVGQHMNTLNVLFEIFRSRKEFFALLGLESPEVCEIKNFGKNITSLKM